MEWWSNGKTNTPLLRYSSNPILLSTKQISDLFSQATAHSLFNLKPKIKRPIPEEPGEGCRGADPAMIKFEIGFEFSDLQGFAKFSPENCFYAHSVARFGENCDCFDGQDLSDSSQLLC